MSPMAIIVYVFGIVVATLLLVYLFLNFVKIVCVTHDLFVGIKEKLCFREEEG
jgi:hypothetical protein